MTPKYGLDRLVNYRIEFIGQFGKNQPDWLDDRTVVSISVDCNITTFTGTYDQAGLLGLLRRLYYLGLPLISVNLIENER
jgi:hypothetical protein